MDANEIASPVCIVTGANAGIGKAAAHKLADAGATVVLACRNQARGEAARHEIIEATGNRNVTLMLLDTSSMKSVRAFVAAFEQQFEHLHVLINNAGNFDLAAKTPVKTAEGFENIFATNYLGPWLLTTLLLPRLRASGSARVINVGSKGLMAYPTLGVEFENLDGSKKFTPARAYYHSKLALLMFTHALALREKDNGIGVNAVRVPAVQLDLDRIPDLPKWLLAVYKLKRRFSITPEAMAKTYAWLALAPEASRLSGELVDENQRAVAMPKRARVQDVSERLWTVSAALTGVKRKT